MSYVEGLVTAVTRGDEEAAFSLLEEVLSRGLQHDLDETFRRIDPILQRKLWDIVDHASETLSFTRDGSDCQCTAFAIPIVVMLEDLGRFDFEFPKSALSSMGMVPSDATVVVLPDLYHPDELADLSHCDRYRITKSAASSFRDGFDFSWPSSKAANFGASNGAVGTISLRYAIGFVVEPDREIDEPCFLWDDMDEDAVERWEEVATASCDGALIAVMPSALSDALEDGARVYQAVALQTFFESAELALGTKPCTHSFCDDDCLELVLANDDGDFIDYKKVIFSECHIEPNDLIDMIVEQSERVFDHAERKTLPMPRRNG